MSAAITPAELAYRVRVLGLRCTEGQARCWLTEWEAIGVCERDGNGWRLTSFGWHIAGDLRWVGQEVAA